MSAETMIQAGELKVGAVRPLFGTLPAAFGSYRYDVSPGGQRVFAMMPNEQAAPEPLMLIQNWTAG